ncbi:LytTR family DNA-binding domain-containing protein [Roseateles amylovorans]|uniref:LytTR family transcriptional regulator n=1 Tax=Roseateles amylovorans TaxID=2978473 RepID=A0ABY6AX52_9BURK|nr:LytTR family DNA-binding domain-containing protein [Roseateles amylovorans]UXH77175.1 LytTR family transcriptional regulator [Roseateles amylovorans]
MTQDDWLRFYLRRRTAFEWTAWTAILLGSALANTVTVYLDVQRARLPFEWWEVASWEFSSALMWILLVPWIVRAMDAKPLRWGQWRRNLPWHLLFSLICSLVHVLGMVALRKLVYAVQGHTYDFGPWARELGYEALKDVRSYAFVVVVAGAYRLMLWRWQGEASLLAEAPSTAPVPGPARLGTGSGDAVRASVDAHGRREDHDRTRGDASARAARPAPGDDCSPVHDDEVVRTVSSPGNGRSPDSGDAPLSIVLTAEDPTNGRSRNAGTPSDPADADADAAPLPPHARAMDKPPRPERLLVKKLGKEFLLPMAEIEWVQACGNYINLHRQHHDYPLRSTLSAFEQTLDPDEFVRVHRSYLVRLRLIEAIEPTEAGDAHLRLRDGSRLPCSRTYLDRLRQQLT